MGRILTLPPSPWERDHIEAVVAGVLYAERHDGDAPDAPAWRWLEHRRDINPERFDRWHGNIGLVLSGYYRHEVPTLCVEVPIQRCEVQSLCEPPPSHVANQVVPEPAALAMLAIGLIAAWGAAR